MKNNIEYIQEPFWKNVLNTPNETQLQIMQQAISDSGYNNYNFVICRK